MQNRFKSIREAGALGLLAGILLLSSLPAAGAPGPKSPFLKCPLPLDTDSRFPAPPAVLARARIMLEAYHNLGEHEALLYDPLFPAVIWARLSSPTGLKRDLPDLAEAVKEDLAGALQADSPSPEEAFALGLPPLPPLPSAWSPEEREASLRRARLQGGLCRSFQVGMQRAGVYLPLIDSVLRREGLPRRLRFLPLVESFFLNQAVSEKEARGLWQFMRVSAQPHLHINQSLDERLDPAQSTRAAARHLQSLHRSLESWPLALTAYVAGEGRVRQALTEMGAEDLESLLADPGNPLHSSASWYYARFLAASTLGSRFRTLPSAEADAEPAKTAAFPLGHPYRLSEITLLTGLPREEMKKLNPALKPGAFRRDARLPKGFLLHLPPRSESLLSAMPAAALPASPPSAAFFHGERLVPAPAPSASSAPALSSRVTLPRIRIPDGSGDPEAGSAPDIASVSQNPALRDLSRDEVFNAPATLTAPTLDLFLRAVQDGLPLCAELFPSTPWERFFPSTEAHRQTFNPFRFGSKLGRPLWHYLPKVRLAQVDASGVWAPPGVNLKPVSQGIEQQGSEPSLSLLVHRPLANPS